MSLHITPPIGTDQQYLDMVAISTGRNLPVIITEPGDYETRSGLKVMIHHVRDVGTASFNCVGSLLRPTKSGRVRPEYSTWSANGRHVALGETPADIVRKL